MNPANETIAQILISIDLHYNDTWDPLTGGTFVHDGIGWYMGEYYPNVDLDQIFWQSPTLWSPTTGVHYTADKASQYIKDCLSKGLLVAVDSGSHASTLWGAEFDDDTGRITKVFVTDPSLEPGVPEGLDTWEVHPDSWNEGNDLSFQKIIWNEDKTSSSSTNMGLRWLYTMTPMPEPSTSLLACLGLSLSCWRRRRPISKGSANSLH